MLSSSDQNDGIAASKPQLSLFASLHRFLLSCHNQSPLKYITSFPSKDPDRSADVTAEKNEYKDRFFKMNLQDFTLEISVVQLLTRLVGTSPERKMY